MEQVPENIIEAAQNSQKNWKIPAPVTIAQWILESGWGKHMPSGSNNPFGIKAMEGQPFVEVQTREVVNGESILIMARFRKFTSIMEAFSYHGQLLADGAPYKHALTLVGNPDAFADALTGVYATDPNYGTELKKLMKLYNLYQYDTN